MSQLKAGALLSYVIIALNTIIGILYTPFMLRMLGQEEYGLYSLAGSVIAYLAVMDFGLGAAITRYTAKYRAEGKLEEQYKLFGLFLKIYIVIGVLVVGLSTVLISNIDYFFANNFNAEELSKLRIMMWLLAINLSVTFPLGVFSSIVTAYERFVFQRVVGIARIIINPLIVILFLMHGYKAISMVAIASVLNIGVLMMNCWYAYFKLKIKIHFGRVERSLIKEISIYSFWVFLNIIMDQLYWGVGQFILGLYHGAVQVAIYAVALNLKGLYFMFSMAISGVLLPRLTAMVVNKTPMSEISTLFIKTGRLQYAILAYVVVGFILLGRPFIAIWAGEGYTDTYYITVILFISLLPALIQNCGVTLLRAMDRQRVRVLIILGFSILSLCAAVPLSRLYGGIGNAIAIAGGVLLGQGLALNIYYRRVIGIDIRGFWQQIAKMSPIPLLFLVGGLLLDIEQYIDSIISFIGVVALFSIIYLPLFWICGLNNYERDLIRKPLRRLITKVRG